MCHICKRFGYDVHLKRCGDCRMITYCSQQHQKVIQDVLRDHPMESYGVSSEEWEEIKVNFMLLLCFKLKRRLKLYEMQMIHFLRECIVCHERGSQLLEDCQNSFSIRTSNSLRLCLHLDLLNMNKKSQLLDLHYLQCVSNTDIFQDMNEFINSYANVQTQHSQYFTRPLMLFYAMKILDYIPKCNKDLIVHVVAVNFIEENTGETWEVLLHLIRKIMSLIIVMIGPELKHKTSLETISVCSNCMLQRKVLLLEFHDVLYENYVHSPSFVKPDLVIGFNAGIQEKEPESAAETWMPSIRILAEQNCPFILTCYVREEVKHEIDRINTILEKKVDYLYCGKNLFACLRPYRVYGCEQVFYQNQYIIIYRSFYS
ncbi:hypothetical protein P5V15_012439 [Pogonomyrmex californicus]